METRFATGDALTAKLFSVKLFRESIKDIFFSKFTGVGFNNIIEKKNELESKKGDTVTFGLKARLTGAGVDTDVDDIEGSEEEITFYNFPVTLIERANAVKAKSKLDLKRPAFDLRTEFKDSLKDWLAEYIDIATITALSTSPTADRNIFGGDATDTASIEASDVLSTSLISKAKRKARLASPKIRGIMINGQERYVLLAHDYQTKALKVESAWQQAQREAGIRGQKNPIFDGALGMWDGVVIHEYERIKTYNDWGTGDIKGARALLLGRQAGVHAYGQLPAWYEKLFQYNRIPGVCVDVVWKAAKTIFDSEDFAVIAIDTYIIPD